MGWIDGQQQERLLYLLMQTEDRRGHSFFKGISLSEYMRDVCCPEEGEMEEENNDDTNDLYLHCDPQPNIANYAIREIDEDNYDEANDHHQLIIQPLHKFDLQRARIVQVDDTRSKIRINQVKKSLPHTFQNQPNSPGKDFVSPKKDMFRSLYGQSFGGDNLKQQERGHLLSTLGMSNWRGKHKSLNKKEADQREKHKRQYQQIIKYENVINQRFDNKLNSIRIDGIKDKIHDRHQRFHKKDNRL